MSVWQDFASLIGVAPRHAEDALHSERCAKATLSRRGMFGASAALAAGVAFGFPEPPKILYYDTEFFSAYPAVFACSVGVMMASIAAHYRGGRFGA